MGEKGHRPNRRSRKAEHEVMCRLVIAALEDDTREIGNGGAASAGWPGAPKMLRSDSGPEGSGEQADDICGGQSRRGGEMWPPDSVGPRARI